MEIQCLWVDNTLHIHCCENLKSYNAHSTGNYADYLKLLSLYIRHTISDTGGAKDR
jgi:hypothetical protein